MSSKIASLRRRILALSKQAGGSDFYNVVWKPNVDDAFKQAQEDAEDEADFEEEEDDDDDHWGGRVGSYSGTILEKHNFKILRHIPETEAEARKAAYKDVEDNDKWGPAFARALIRTPGHKKKTEGWLFYGIASS